MWLKSLTREKEPASGVADDSAGLNDGDLGQWSLSRTLDYITGCGFESRAMARAGELSCPFVVTDGATVVGADAAVGQECAGRGL